MPSRPLDERWDHREVLAKMKTEFGHIVDVEISLRRFRNYYSEGQVSRDWSAKFENWMLNDVQRAGTTSGTDDLGIPYHQKSSVPPSAEEIEKQQQELIDLAVRSARERTEQP